MLHKMNLFQDYIRIGLLGLGHSGLDAQIRHGIYQFRGPSRSWLFRDFGFNTDMLQDSLQGAPHLACAGFLGRVAHSDQMQLLRDVSQPVVTFLESHTRPEWVSHRISGEAAGRMAAEYFIGMGYRNLALVAHDSIPPADEIWRGFQSVAKEKGVRLLACLRGKGDRREVEQQLPDKKTYPISSSTEWLLAAPKPIGLFCTSDRQALRYSDFCQFQGLSIPDHVAVLGHGNDESLCLMNYTPISSIALPGEKLGWMLAEELERRIQGREHAEPACLPPERVVVRESTNRIAMEDPVIAELLRRMHHLAAERTPIQKLCEGLPLNRRSVNERFLKAMGRSIREELFRIRVELAKSRLLETDQTVYQIALECGFADPESMSAYFKKWVGCTPTQYRKQTP